MAESSLSNRVQTTTTLPAPSNLSATVNSSSVDLTWTNNDDSSDGSIDVYRSSDGGSSWSEISNNLSPNTSSFTDSSISAGNTYQYYVYRTTSHTNAQSSTITVETTAPPSSPQNLTASVSGSDITLDWDSVNWNGDQGHYDIKRGTISGSYSEITTVSSGITTYTDSGLSDGIEYFYVVEADNSKGGSGNSNEVSPTTALPSPTSLSVTSISGSTVDISWTDNHSNGDTRIEYKLSSNSSWTTSDTVSIGTESETFNLAENKDYDSRVVAVTSDTESVSTTVTFTTANEFSKTVTSYSSTLSSSVKGLISLLGSVSSHSKKGVGQSTRTVNISESISSHSTSFSSSNSRGNISLSRTDESWSTVQASTATRTVSLLESVESSAFDCSATSARDSIGFEGRTNESSSSLCESNSIRIVALLESVSSHIKLTNSFVYNERTSLEVVDHNITWNDSKAEWYTEWYSESKIIDSEDRMGIRSLIVDDAKEPAAIVIVEYDANGNGKPNKQTEPIHLSKYEDIDEVEGVPVGEDGYYRIRIIDYSGYNSVYALDTALIN